MAFSKRQTLILESTRRSGSARISDLAAELDVSLETIRRDIRSLVETGEIVKSHGLVSLARQDMEAPFERRMRENLDAKIRIARHVAAGIADGDSVMMDTGTTTSVLARELRGKTGLTIVTNSSDVARTLATVNGNKVYMAGGELHGDNGAAFGRSAIDFVSAFRVRHVVISIAAIDPVGGLMDYHLADFARTVLGCGETRTVITDHSKFNRRALVRVAGFLDVDRIVTDMAPPPEITERLLAAGTALEIAA